MFSSLATTALAPRRRPASRKLARIVQPTQVERFFKESELIVSKTDLTGKLTYVNRTFMAIADYGESELLGQPHSIIRHPDMPRAIFQLLWDRLKDRQEVFAYVKNMARNGDHYWVLAHVTPSFTPGGEAVGYHSNRRVPDRGVLSETIIPLYRSLKEIEDSEPDRKLGLRKSSERLNAVFAEKGIDYAEFVLKL